VLGLTLAGCKSAEEKAEEHYQSGLALMEQGDYERAIIEFRNVFQLNDSHLEARHELARLLRQHAKDPSRAYRQYLRVAEQFPDDIEARIALSEIAFENGNWDEVERHGAAAEELAPDDPQVKAIIIARGYRSAVLEENASARRDQARAAKDLMVAQGDNFLLRSVLIDDNLREGNYSEALAGVDWMLERDPEDQTFWRQRLNILAEMGDMDAVETQLNEMVEKFPDELANKQALVRFYLSRGQNDKVESFLRAQVAAAAPDNPAPMVDLLQFLQQQSGPDVLRAELDKAIAEQANPIPFQIMRAGLDFESGERNKAIADLEALLAANEPSEETRNAKVTLARMLIMTGNEVGARARVEEILVEEPGQPDALKMQASWQIQSDKTDEAVANLRTALDTNPDDAQAMTLMSEAYMRAGRSELARDFLALAVDASGNAPEESIRYARLLMQEERYLPAEDILLPAVRLAPRNTGLLAVLGDLYIRMEDNGRAEQVIQTLRQIEDDVAQEAANGLEVALINQKGGFEEAMRYLEGIAQTSDASLNTQIALIRARLLTGDTDGARTLAREQLDRDPQNAQSKAILASVEAATGDLGAAEALYRDLLEGDNSRADIWLELIRLRFRQGEREDAVALMDEALALLPEDPNLLWAKASFSERQGDIEGAIAIYEGLYERNSGSIVVANNLASLLATHRADEESLERAWTVARRLRDTEIPAMQDTYGWIAHRRGESETALPYLESAAANLQDDPVVQYHLGQVYLALNRTEDALAQFEKAVEIAGPGDQRAQIEDARAQIKAQRSGKPATAEN
jgi:tetratricopeptide (TPR) repeat protein